MCREIRSISVRAMRAGPSKADLDSARQLTAQQVADFRTRGYIVLPGFFDAKQVAAISEFLSKLSESNGPEGKFATYFEESPVTGETLLMRCEHILGEHNPDFTRQVLNPDTVGVLTQLLGSAPVVFKDKVNYKPPGSRSDLLHQDQQAGWGTYSKFFVNMMVAVDENKKENGPVSFRDAGDHRLELQGPEFEVLSKDDPPTMPESEYWQGLAKPGDVVLFDSYIPHGSPGNTSQLPRRNLYLTFNAADDGDHRQRYYEDKWVNYGPNTRDAKRDGKSFRV